MRSLAFIFISLILFFSDARSQTCSVIKLKPVGKTFKIEEKDFLQVLQNQLSHVDWQALNEKIREEIFAYKPLNSAELEPAKKHAVRYHDPTFVLPFDIKDAEGNVIYAAGIPINPLDRIPEAVWKNRVYIFFNLQDKWQRKFVSYYLKKYGTEKMITLIADGHSDLKQIHDFIKRIYFPVYALTSLVARRFGVDKDLSLVTFVKKNGRGLVRIEEMPDRYIRNLLGGEREGRKAVK